MPAAVFLDRDGVLNEDVPGGVLRAEEFRIIPGALEALALLARARIPVILITNQANVGRGKVARAAVEELHARLLAQVREAGGAIRAIYVCYHAPEDACLCRKPAPGLLLQAAAEHGLALPDTVFVGDDGRDLEAAARAGAPAALVRTGKGRSIEPRVLAGELRAASVHDDLLAFARAITRS
jgi:D-glycero-D-manno-heptose 1,7-bisphosphate phosphatase